MSTSQMQTVDVRPQIRAPSTQGPAQVDEQETLGNAAVQQRMSERSSAEGMAPSQTEDEKLSYATATTPITNDLTPTGSSGLTRISLSDVDIQGTAYEDGFDWKIRVDSATTAIHWGINSSGYTTPDPQDGGNITKDNWQTVITELEGYEARQASGSWHHPDATEAHELDHVNWYSQQAIATWPGIETVVQAHVLTATNQEEADRAMATYLPTQERAWFNAYGLAPEPQAYAIGQAVLDGIITQIREYATSKGWTT